MKSERGIQGMSNRIATIRCNAAFTSIGALVTSACEGQLTYTVRLSL